MGAYRTLQLVVPGHHAVLPSKGTEDRKEKEAWIFRDILWDIMKRAEIAATREETTIKGASDEGFRREHSRD